MKHHYILTALVALLISGCITSVSPEKAARVDLKTTGLVLATLTRTGEASDVKRVTVEFYLRQTDGRASIIKDLVVNSTKELWLIKVPLGHYRISDWFLASGTSLRESSNQGFEFDVRPGEITYIGHFDVGVSRSKNAFGLRVIPRADSVLFDDLVRTESSFKEAFHDLSSVHIRNAAPKHYEWGASKSSAIPVYVPVPNIK